MQIYCSYCGAENAANARFCRSCRKLIALPGAHTVVRPPMPPAGTANAGQQAIAPVAGYPARPAAPSPWPSASAQQSWAQRSPDPLAQGWGAQPRGQQAMPAPPILPEGPPSRRPALPALQPAPTATPAAPGYRIDPMTGLAYDPRFAIEPLPDAPSAGLPAPFFPRLGALLVDYCILSVLWFCLVGLAALVDSAALGVIATFLGPALYFIAFWATGGRTPGYRAAGLQLVHTDGTSVGVGASIVRYIGSLISWPLFCLGYLWMLWDPKAQTWHDKMADTTVIQS